MKNGKERMNEIFDKNKKGGLVWTTFVDNITLSGMSEPYRSMGPMDFYRHLGCDIFDLRFDRYVQGFNPAKQITHEVEIVKTEEEDGTKVTVIKTQWGDLVSKVKYAHPVKYPVRTKDDLVVFKKMWQNTDYVEIPGSENAYRDILSSVGENGIIAEVFDSSPVQRLLQIDMGVESFYYLLEDEKHEMEELLDIMHEKWKKEYEIVAKNSLLRACIPIENTSIEFVSPYIYNKYEIPQLKDYVDILHKYNKTAIIHMCGKVLNLLEMFKKIGADGIHALCEPSIGDTPYEEAFHVLGDDLILVAIIDPAIFMDPNASADDLVQVFKRQIRPDVYEKNVIFAAPADGMPMDYWKFELLKEWIDRNTK